MLVGYGWQKGLCNLLMVFNVVFNVVQFWDGCVKDLGEQVKGLIQNSVEMYSILQLVEQILGSILEYVDVFCKVFFKVGKLVSFDNMVLVIEVYEVILVILDLFFDLYFKGDDKVFDVQQKKGFKVFMDSGCSVCYNGINLGGQVYFLFGLVKKFDVSVLFSGDKGCFVVIKIQSDEYVFCVVFLCNVVFIVLYFYSGQVWEFKDVVVIMGNVQFGKQLVLDDVENIVVFLYSLSGKQLCVEYLLLLVSMEIMLCFVE